MSKPNYFFQNDSTVRSTAPGSAPQILALSSAPRFVALRWCHIASTSIATLNRVAKLGAMTYGAETCYLSAVVMAPVLRV